MDPRRVLGLNVREIEIVDVLGWNVGELGFLGRLGFMGKLRFLTLGWLLEETHMTWVHLEKKRSRLQTTQNLLKIYAYSGWRRCHRHKATPS
nr:hypothetical protein [Tanacetum cinerariifolium]